MVFLRTAIIALSFVVLGTEALAQVSIINEEQNDSDFLLELTKALDPNSVSVMGVFDKVPKAENNKDIAPGCDPKFFEDKLLSAQRSPHEYAKLVKQYIQTCQSELAHKSPKGLLSLAKMALDDYKFLKHPQVKTIKIPLSNGVIVPAIVGLKQDPRPRPLVIMKCGVFCGADQNAFMKTFMIQLFDLTPYNVVLLANQTGLDYLKINGHFSLGGWSEGYESLLAGKWLREQWEYKDRISSMHLMGMSLGGNAAVYGAAFNDIYPTFNGHKVFNSATAICPVVSLKPTLENLYNDNLVGPVFNMMSRAQFRAARKHLTDIPDMVAEERLPGRKHMPSYLGEMAVTSMQRRGVASTSQTEFFFNNNFWNIPHKLQTPLMVFGSKDDNVVSNKLNTQVFEFDEHYEKAANVGVINVSYGNHCAFSAAYGYQLAAMVLRGFVMTHSPEFSDFYKRSEMAWKFGFSKIPNVYQHIGQSWKFEANSDQVAVTFKMFNSVANKSCYYKNPYSDSSSGCVTSRKIMVPVSGLKALGARMPVNDVEAQALTRQFNSKVEFVSGGKPLNGTSNSSFNLSWRPLFE
ncbi:alpha/beta hydrolase family protein [Bdellovibrio sp. HCB288]|uniref:alpha/beta hydrolase family protein n=1 Tax=Bdellovibrio sp. HCB288 TaxID=3394355 RepID=UPI0039B40CE8